MNNLPTFFVTVYTGQFKEEIEVQARNQDHLRQRVRGLGYDRITHISKVTR